MADGGWSKTHLSPMTVNSARPLSLWMAFKIIDGPIPEGSPMVRPTRILVDFDIGPFFKFIYPFNQVFLHPFFEQKSLDFILDFVKR